MLATTAADVNWMLSALAQASAALVAIVGGLLVSRYVTLHAEQQAARRRVEDLARRQDEARMHLDEAQRELDLYFVDEFLDDDDVFQVILHKEFNPTAEDVLAAADNDEGDLNLELLESRLGELSSELNRALTEIYPLVPVSKSHDDEWSDFRRKHGFAIGHRGAWAWAYEKACESRRDEAKSAEREARKKSPFGSLPVYDDLLLRSIALTSPEVRGLRSVVSAQHEIAEVGSLRSRVEQAKAEIGAMQQERRLAEETYDATRQPEGFVLALQVLMFLALVGMCVPVVVMGFAPLTLPAWGRVGVIALFFSGVAPLLRFLFVYAGFLREGGRDTLPLSAFGLLRKAPRRPSPD